MNGTFQYMSVCTFSESAQQPSQISEAMVDALPVEMVRNASSMLAPGIQCRVCLRGYETGQIIKKLPCNHKVTRQDDREHSNMSREHINMSISLQIYYILS